MSGNLVADIYCFHLFGTHLGDIQIGFPRETALVFMAQQRRAQIEGTLYTVTPQKFGQASVLHHTVVVAQRAGLSLSSGEYQRIEPFAHNRNLLLQ